ncbi:MAG: PTS sugar transporter subunit IIB [Ruminococcus flavefaciens]|nr:PTS sugar transporter subunit IIB [Ruminococcus flavefaciens]
MKKLKITLACSGGMSTSILCTRIKKAAEARGYTDVECNAYAETKLEKVVEGSDIILIGPQIRHLFDKISKRIPNIPIEIIDMKDYGMMNGEKIFAELCQKYDW